MKYLSRLLFVAVAAFGLAACNDGADFIGPNGEQPGDMKVNVAFSLADKAVLTRSKVSGTENRVHTLQMVCFDANGLYLGIRKAEIEPEAGPTPDTGKIKGTVPQGTSRIHFIANRNLSIPLSFRLWVIKFIQQFSLIYMLQNTIQITEIVIQRTIKTHPLCFIRTV